MASTRTHANAMLDGMEQIARSKPRPARRQLQHQRKPAIAATLQLVKGALKRVADVAALAPITAMLVDPAKKCLVASALPWYQRRQPPRQARPQVPFKPRPLRRQSRGPLRRQSRAHRQLQQAQQRHQRQHQRAPTLMAPRRAQRRAYVVILNVPAVKRAPHTRQ